jgi:predicted acyltransferase
MPALAYSNEPSEAPVVPARRLISLDAYRGFVMLLMASEGLGITKFVRDTHAGGWWPAISNQTQHVEWRGCSLWDLIQPSFTFIVGVAMPFSLAKRRAEGQSFMRMFFHALWRSFLLIALGIFLRSINKPITNFTFEDTLSQIGLGYTFAFLLAWTRPRWQAIAIGVILVGYWMAFALWPLPPGNFDYSKVGVTPAWQAQHQLTGFANHWGKNTNFAAAFDAKFLNLFPRPKGKPFLYNAGGYLTLSFIPTLATMLLGLLAGGLLRSGTKYERNAWILVIAGLIGLVAGTLLDLTGVCPSVKRIWTPAWVLFSGGWCCLLMAAFYAFVDIGRMRAWAFPMIVTGANSIAIYCLADGGFRTFIYDSLHVHGVSRLLDDTFGRYSLIANWTATLVILWLILLWMYRRKIFIRI